MRPGMTMPIGCKINCDMTNNRRRRRAVSSSLKWGLIFAALLSVLPACGSRIVRREFVQVPDAVKLNYAKDASFLKAHMRDGGVYVLDEWHVDKDKGIIDGKGEYVNASRQIPLSAAGDRSEYFSHVSVPLDSVVLFETNVLMVSPAVGALTVITAISVGVTIACISNPKACFGSCPTFYASDGEEERLQAEGFSSSVAPCLEARDIDALYRARPEGRRFAVTMKNEALETHVVRYVDLLALPRDEGSRVFVTSSGDFWQARDLTGPGCAQSAAGECTDKLIDFDRDEYFSESDSTDLAAREDLDMEFEFAGRDSLGLIIASRQSLVSTFLLYQTLAYMGRSVGDWFAALERADDDLKAGLQGVRDALGRIEVLCQDEQGEWVVAGAVGETGPLATDVRIVPLPPMGSNIKKIKLRLVKGYWRLDYAALATLQKRVEPMRLKVEEIMNDGRPDPEALSTLLDVDNALTTFPGDEYTLIYQLPEDYRSRELFLESKGYYLEWIRDEWLEEENLPKAMEMMFNPQAALKRLASEYKMVEADMEEDFWNSKYEK